jgi:hypothetical protein
VISETNRKHKASESGDDGSGKGADVEQIQADIAQTRQELGETVDALTARLDVKTRARAQVDLARQRAIGQLNSAKSSAAALSARARSAAVRDDGTVMPAIPAGAVLLTVLGVGVFLRRRRTR